MNTAQVPEHRLILWEKIGPGSHPCHHCKRTVTWMVGEYTRGAALVTDHLDRDKRNNDPANLVPSCQRCNIRNRAQTVLDSEDYSINAVGNRVRGERRDCGYCGTSFVAWPDNRPNRGRFCSRRCGYANRTTRTA